MKKSKALLPLSRALEKRGRRSKEDRMGGGSSTRGSTTTGGFISSLLRHWKMNSCWAGGLGSGHFNLAKPVNRFINRIPKMEK